MIINKLNHISPENKFSVLALLLYIALGIIKIWGFATSGRFWAEEGAVFYPSIVNSNFIDGIFFFYNGHMELITNFIVYISTLFDLKYAPLFTTYLSLIVQTIPIAIIIYFRKNLELPAINVIAFIIIATGIPQAAEVWSNSINLHFHFAFLASLIAVIDPGEYYPKKLFRTLLFLSGLSGIPANFLLPVFLFIALNTKQRERWIQLGILASTAILQLTIIYFHNFNTGHREFDTNPILFWLPILSQTVVAPLFNINYGELLSYILADTMVIPPQISVS